MRLPPATYREAFERHEDFLWGLCYRMTGSSADADDLVQDTFARVLEHPPREGDASTWRPWLVRIAVNLARDHLRRRKRRGYVGPWLPTPVEMDLEGERDDEAPGTEARYATMESVSFAFLIALEALTPQQRAVLLLRDVFDYSIRETADALALSEANVKTTHHRARAAMRGYDEARCVPSRALQAKTRAALEQFVAGLMADDMPSIEAALSDRVLSLNDGGGEFSAARSPIVGRHKVALFYRNVSPAKAPDGRFEMRMVNGLPAIVADVPSLEPPVARRSVVLFEADAAGGLVRIYSVVASAKLARFRFFEG